GRRSLLLSKSRRPEAAATTLPTRLLKSVWVCPAERSEASACESIEKQMLRCAQQDICFGCFYSRARD
ncbi:MAG TPA: hypothetical protein VGY31_01555, partial [Terriglobia bacterium]|nr:hypothetical protein [Terriglobia bacterium]